MSVSWEAEAVISRVLDRLCQEVGDGRMKEPNPHVLTLAMMGLFPGKFVLSPNEVLNIRVRKGKAVVETLTKKLNRDAAFHEVIQMKRTLTKFA